MTLPTHPAIDAVMSTAASLLGMEIVFLGGLTPDSFTFDKVRAHAEWPGIAEGDKVERTSTLCHYLLDGAPSRTTDAPHEPAYANAGAVADLGIVSYVGVPIRDGAGTVVATLCGIDRSAVEVSDDTLEVLTRLAEVIATNLGPIVAEGVVIRPSKQTISGEMPRSVSPHRQTSFSLLFHGSAGPCRILRDMPIMPSALSRRMRGDGVR